MNIAIRLFIGYFIIVGLSAWFLMSFVVEEVKPVLRQATEETLVDVANVLAELVASELSSGAVSNGQLSRAVQLALVRRPGAKIWGISKATVDLRIYVTDAAGTVVYDSEGRDVGADYSQWRDVILAMRGEYGARSSLYDPDDPRSSVMYVAAPVEHEGRRIGVLTVGKPGATLQPYLNEAQRRVGRMGMLLLGFSALIGLLFTWWLTWSLNRMRDYAHALAEGRKAQAPAGGGRQLTELARALTLMRERLDGKQYVERYVQSLAHELKSPLSAVRGAAELLADMPAEADRDRFVRNIGEQSARMQLIIERLLALARIEQLQTPEDVRTTTAEALIGDTLASRHTQLQAHELAASVHGELETVIRGDLFLLQQALANLLDNAIGFSPRGGRIDIDVTCHDGQVAIAVEDHGPGAPEYALPHVFERFYSLPRIEGGRKSTGLGLAFVREVARIHGGDADFANQPDGGACVRIILPR